MQNRIAVALTKSRQFCNDAGANRTEIAGSEDRCRCKLKADDYNTTLFNLLKLKDSLGRFTTVSSEHF